jgi:L-ribulose-5-phosphate 3-epimerase
MTRLRFAFNTNGLAHHRLADAIDLLADLGYDGVAITPDIQHLDPYRLGPREVEGIAAHLARRGLGCCVQTGARFVLDPTRKHRPNLLDAVAEDRARRLDFLVRCLDIARDLGAEALAFWSGAASDDASPGELDDRLAEGCHALAEAGAVRGVRVAFEPEPGMLIETVAQWERLRDRVAHTNLGLALDVGHVHCNREGDAAEVVRRQARELLDVQIEDMREDEHLHLPFGEGTLDPAPILAALGEVGYAGLVGVELSRDSHRAPAVAAASIELLRGLSP